MKNGRPTKYIEKFHCDDIIRLQKNGLTLYEVASEWNVCVDTIREWKQVHAKFSSAFMRAREELRSWYDRTARERLIDVTENGNSIRLNDRTLRFLYYTNFKESENSTNSVVDLPISFYESNSVDVKQSILDTQLALKVITVSQYDTLSKTIQLQFDRKEGLEALREVKELKELISKVKSDKEII